MVDTSNITLRRGLDVLDREMDRCAPMRFVRHRDAMAWQKCERMDTLAVLVKQGRLYIQQTAMPWAQQFRGGPLVV